MLYFQSVCTDELKAVTHIDASPIIQITRDQKSAVYDLLNVFKRRAGFGVLCNTSLNWKSQGFVNRNIELSKYAKERDIDAVVSNTQSYMPVAAGHLGMCCS